MPVLRLDVFQKDLFGGIRGENFRAFLQICFSHADCFSVSRTTPPGYELVPNAAETQLAPYLLKNVAPQSWYGYGQIRENMVQCVYAANRDTLRILCQCYTDVFLDSKKQLPKVSVDTVGRQPKRVSTLENLCFFSEHHMILGTVSHERICSTNRINADFAGQLMGIGRWLREPDPQFGIDRVCL